MIRQEHRVFEIQQWWYEVGRVHYPKAQRLLVLADAGGSNAARSRVFKKFLQEKIADEYALSIAIAHYPTGASKWNPIEHRMFSEISKNWAELPLVSFQTLIEAARATRTTTGLRIDAYRDEAVYEKGVKVSDQQMKKLHLTQSEHLGKWNYTITPVPAAQLVNEQDPQARAA